MVGKFIKVCFAFIFNKFYSFQLVDNFDPNIIRFRARAFNPKYFDQILLSITHATNICIFDKQTYPKIVSIDKNQPPTHIEQILKNFFSNKLKKIFMLKSDYGTGKTSMIKKIISVYKKIKRILYITNRQSVAISFFTEFSKLGFKTYLSTDFDPNSDRVIVNVDSLTKLIIDNDIYMTTVFYQQYDLVILDEMTSIDNHFESNLIFDIDKVFKVFWNILNSSPKIICCDGDLDNREFFFARQFDKNVIINVNTFVPHIYHYVFHRNEYDFIQRIEYDLKNKEKIVFVSMSSAECDKIRNRFADSFRTLTITANTSNDIKNAVSNIEKLITDNNIQLLIYSPTITVGVDISITYFDKIYGYMCYGSVGARDFCQMLNRVRNPISDDIHIFLHSSIPKSQIANFYSFKEVCSIEGIVINNDHSGIPIINDYKTSLQLLRLWNKVEELNNKLYLFPLFLNYITAKGHVYSIYEEETKIIYDHTTVANIIAAPDISYMDCHILMEKAKANDVSITQDNKYSIQKCLYSTVFNIPYEYINESFMLKHYGKLI